MSDCRIYVACLASYNSGVLHGLWIEDPDIADDDAIAEKVSAMLRASKFPNVTVPCLDCTGPAPIADLGDPAYTPCGTCGGKGEVPSAEEWAIHDREGFGSLVDEYTPFERVAELAAAIEEHGAPFIAYMESDSTSDVDDFGDYYVGEYGSLADYAEESCDGMGEVPEWVAPYIDYQKMGRDMQMGGDVWTADAPGGNIYVFRNC